MEETLFDVLFAGKIDYVDLRNFRIKLAHRIYAEEAVTTDDLRWQYVLACLTADYSKAAIGLQFLVIFNCMFVHRSLRETLRQRLKGEENLRFFAAYMEYFDHVMSDFNSSDPLRTAENWPRSLEFLREAWLSRDLTRPWNSVATRCALAQSRIRLKQPAKAKGVPAKKTKTKQ
jgi:hypothetical protein